LFRRLPPVVWVLTAALLLRVAAAFSLQAYLDGIAERKFLIPGDANGYWELAGKLAAGEEFAIYDPPRRIMRMPGFPALLVLSGGDLLTARLMLAVIGTAACWFTFLLGRELVDGTAGMCAAAVMAVSPAQVGFSVLILTETTFAAAMTFSLLLMARLLRAEKESTSSFRQWLTAFACGVAVAGACYFRPSWLLFGPAFALLLLIRNPRSRREWVAAALIPLGMAVALSPWIVRNYRVTGGRVVVTTLWAGPSLYDGLNREASGNSDMTFFDRDRLPERMTEYEVDREYRRRAWEFVRENPGRAAELAGVKLGRFWSPWPNARQLRRGWIIGVAVVFFLVTFVPAVYGAWLMRRRFSVLSLTLGPVLYFSAIHAVFVGSIRYRMPVEFAVAVLTGAGIAALYRRRAGSVSDRSRTSTVN